MKNFKCFLRNQSGFSLTELLVVAGVMGVMSIGVMKLTQNGMEGNKRVEAGAQINETRSEIVGIMSNVDNCMRTFQSSPSFTGVVAGGSKSLTSIMDKNGNVRFATGSALPGGVVLSNMVVKDFNASTSTAGLYLDYQYKLNSQTPQTKTKRFDIQVAVDGAGNLTSCGATAGVQTLDERQLCDTVVGYDGDGNSYFTGGQCQFGKASCEKSGGTWNVADDECGQSHAQKFLDKVNACQNLGGYLSLATKSSLYKTDGNITYRDCQLANIQNGEECYCRTDFMYRFMTPLPAPTMTGADSVSVVKQLTLNGVKFNVASVPFTITNPFPDNNNRARRVVISASMGVENWAAPVPPSTIPEDRWIVGSIGCVRYGQIVSYPDEANVLNWIPSEGSTFGTTLYNGNKGFSIWGGTRDHYKDTPGTVVKNLNIPENLQFREHRVNVSRDGILTPGDVCSVMLYTNNMTNHEVRVTAAQVTVQHYTDDNSYGYGPNIPTPSPTPTPAPPSGGGVAKAPKVIDINPPLTKSTSSSMLETEVVTSSKTLK